MARPRVIPTSVLVGRPGRDGSNVMPAEAAFVPHRGTAPDPDVTPVYVDTSVEPPALLGWDGATWVAIGGGVGGADVGIDADGTLTIDGVPYELSTDAERAAAIVALGLGTASTKNTGTTSGTVPVLGGSGLLAAAVVPASLRGLGGPNYNITPGAFPNWRAKMSAVRAAINIGGTPAFAKMLAIGDSTAAGTVSTGADAHNKAWPSVAAKLLDTYHIPTQRSGTWGASSTGNGVADPRVTVGTGWVQAAALKILGNNGWMASTSASGQLTFTQTFDVDTFVITYTTNSGLGTTVVKSDGVTIGTLNTSGASLDTAQVVYTVTKGAHTLTLDPPTVGSVFIDHIEAYDSTRPSVRFSMGAKGGTKVADYNATGTTAEHWRTKSFVKPDLTLVSLTVNDAQAATNVATYTASMTTLINNLKSGGSDVLLVIGPPAYNDASNVGLTPYVNALYGLCDTLNVGLVDTMARFTSYAFSSPYGYYDGGSLHLSTLGNADLGQGVFNALKTL